jgi:hypothetical protein
MREWEEYKSFLHKSLWADSEYAKAYYEARANAKLASFQNIKKSLLLIYNTNE